MQRTLVLFFAFLTCNCHQSNKSLSPNNVTTQPAVDSLQSYETVKHNIIIKRKDYLAHYSTLTVLTRKEDIELLTDYWVRTIADTLYEQWENTGWDFNGTTLKPHEGTIACGYFVTTILRDMDLVINRQKLSVCPSSEMMHRLVPRQKIKNLSYLSYVNFNDSLKQLGKGVYIIGLDFHTGFIVNDGVENWFIHSNYIGRKGVVKESVLRSVALRSSKTRWLTSLTGDKNFLLKWIKGLS